MKRKSKQIQKGETMSQENQNIKVEELQNRIQELEENLRITSEQGIEKSQRISELESSHLQAEKELLETEKVADRLRQRISELQARPDQVDQERLSFLENKNDRLKGALQRLVSQIDFVFESKAYKAVWTHYKIRFVQYKGPTFDNELKTAREELERVD